MTGTAAAQAYHVAPAAIEVGAWTFNPVYQDSGTAADGTPLAPFTVTGYLALADVSTAGGSNIVSVWYSPNGDGTWSAKAWDSADPWVAVKTVKDSFSISDDEDGNWEIQGIPANIAPMGDAPKDYEGGLLTIDPLADLVNSSPNRDQIVEALVAVGYMAADVPVDKLDPCTTKDDKLNIFAAETAEALTGDAASKEVRARAVITTGFADCCIAGGSIILNVPCGTSVGIPTWTYACAIVFTSVPSATVAVGQTCQTWTSTTTFTDRRARIKICTCDTWVGTLPYPCGLCLQSRTNTRVLTYNCCSNWIGMPTPCPPAPPPGAAFPAGGALCPMPLPSPAGTFTWGPWAPSCGF